MDSEKPVIGSGGPPERGERPEYPPEPIRTDRISDDVMDKAERIGKTGLTDMQGRASKFCVSAFGDGQFTVAMLCAQTGLDADIAVETMHQLHEIGIVRCPVNDGGQQLYQMMPGIVHPKAAGARF